MLALINDPENIESFCTKYSELMNLLFELADTLTFIKGKEYYEIDDSFEKEMLPYLKKSETMSYWYGHFLECDESASELDVNFYDVNENTKIIMLKYFKNIFLDEQESILKNKKKYVSLVKERVKERDPEGFKLLCSVNHPFLATQSLSDLGFFVKGSMIAATVSHEQEMAVWPPDGAFEERLDELGDWTWTPCEDELLGPRFRRVIFDE